MLAVKNAFLIYLVAGGHALPIVGKTKVAVGEYLSRKKFLLALNLTVQITLVVQSCVTAMVRATSPLQLVVAEW